MNAGIILKDSLDEKSPVVFLGDEVSCHSVETNEEIAELIVERQPEVVAVDAGTEQSPQEFTKQEEELREEGHAFTPTSHEPRKTKRLESLKARLFQEMGAAQPEIIRFDPNITAKELAIHGDEALKSYGIDGSSIGSAEQFDAMLGAITARFYEQNQVKDLGVIIPEPLNTSETENNKT